MPLPLSLLRTLVSYVPSSPYPRLVVAGSSPSTSASASSSPPAKRAGPDHHPSPLMQLASLLLASQPTPIGGPAGSMLPGLQSRTLSVLQGMLSSDVVAAVADADADAAARRLSSTPSSASSKNNPGRTLGFDVSVHHHVKALLKAHAKNDSSRYLAEEALRGKTRGGGGSNTDAAQQAGKDGCTKPQSSSSPSSSSSSSSDDEEWWLMLLYDDSSGNLTKLALDIPGGKRHLAESVFDNAVRETLEETGHVDVRSLVRARRGTTGAASRGEEGGDEGEDDEGGGLEYLETEGCRFFRICVDGETQEQVRRKQERRKADEIVAGLGDLTLTAEGTSQRGET